VTTLERLRALLARDFDIAPEKLVPEATLEDLGIDSLQMIEIVFCIEDEFGIKVDADAAEVRARVGALQDLAAFIDERKAAA
jgi:acyl carrier protein